MDKWDQTGTADYDGENDDDAADDDHRWYKWPA